MRREFETSIYVPVSNYSHILINKNNTVVIRKLYFLYYSNQVGALIRVNLHFTKNAFLTHFDFRPLSQQRKFSNSNVQGHLLNLIFVASFIWKKLQAICERFKFNLNEGPRIKNINAQNILYEQHYLVSTYQMM